ncbi:GIY-YIG nuclease family protein [Streptomyces sp. NBC_00258]|uniref:GIY-YIG nuclease family protein n=1 Tax=Streptomyces sp. NBC_00258 TaxID=2903642 RepID=UPI002E2DC00E|nr:GIY-YIG nuclease family protein [Streptomyces sp. NBC_00258]
MGQTFTVHLKIADCPIRGVSLNWRLFQGSEVRREAPSYGTDIEIPAVIEILDLIESGAATAQEARAVLNTVATKIIEEKAREYEDLEDRMKSVEAVMSVRRRIPKQPALDSRWVYVVSSEDNPKAVKIGVATEIEGRMKSLQAGSASPLVLRWSARGGFLLERHLHDRFDQRRINGEWFDFRRVADPVEVIVEAADEFLRQFGEFNPDHE